MKKAAKPKNIFHILSTHIERPLAFYDIGVGPFPKNEAQQLLRFFPSMKVFGCEPHPSTFRQREITFPGPLLEVALGEDGFQDLYLAGAQSSIYSFDFSDAPVAKVKSMTLDAFDKQAGGSSRIFLWLDVEGAESKILLSGPDLFASQRVKWINVEVRTSKFHSAKEKENAEQLPSIMEDFQFKKALSYNNQRCHHDELWVRK